MTNKSTASKDLLALEHEDFAKKPNPFLINNENREQNKTKPNIAKPEVSSLLSRVKDFLPKIDEANKQLQQQIETTNSNQFDIENIDEEKPHIEMNLALGVLEEKKNLEETLVINPNAPVIPEGINLIEQLSSEDDEDEDEDDEDEDEEMQHTFETQ